MVGLVIVSHSRELAEALLHFVRQVTRANLPIAIAAGVGKNRSEFGTDALEIMEAIRSVFSPEGVLVLMDLGSAILSAQMAEELLEPEIATHIRFCAAPLVEGAIAAAVQISLGSDLDTICREAQQALLPKQAQIEGTPPSAPSPLPPATPPRGESTREVILTLKNLHGLHARPAARFVQTVAQYKAEVSVSDLTNGKGPVSAHSLNAIATLGAVEGHQIRVAASGPESEAVLQALTALVEDGFGEPIAEAASGGEVPSLPAEEKSTEAEGVITAIPISEGIAIAPLYRFRLPLPAISDEPAKDRAQEWEKLEHALEISKQTIERRASQMRMLISPAEAAIFDVHLLILQDPELREIAQQNILQKGQNASAGWNAAAESIAARYRSLPDAYLQQRAADVEDVKNQVLLALAGQVAVERISFPQAVILYADEITPTQTAQLDMNAVAGIVTRSGGPTSHSAILARALGIPAVSGVGAALESVPEGTPLALDGSKGRIWLHPGGEALKELSERQKRWQAEREAMRRASFAPATTRDGQRIEVVANVGNVSEAQVAVQNGAEGIGLLRTEFLFLTRTTPPDESEQFTVLQQIGATMQGRPIIVRTLDVGGDKEVPYIQLPAEANPFLGVRAIRMSLRHKDLFLPQLRAILRAGYTFPFRIMFPMVANLEEVRQARALMAEAHRQLTVEQIPHAWPIETGIMVEIPSAALLSEQFAPEVDFFSIGTNDLTQYTLAAERGNPLLSEMSDALHPAVLRLIKTVVEAAHRHGKWVGVCGELAGDPLAVPVLVGLGVDELSLNPAGIPRVKSILGALEIPATRHLASQILEMASATEARQAARQFLSRLGVLI
jgi:phosphocarrier protein FPr